MNVPFYGGVYPNRVDVIGRGYSEDEEHSRIETDVPRARGVPCSVQEAQPSLLLTMGLIQEQETDAVYFHPESLRRAVPSGIVVNDHLVQTDTSPPRVLVVVGIRDPGGLGLGLCAVCRYVGDGT